MIPTRSELMYFAMGVAVGGVVGANWSKVRPMLEAFMGPAADGFRDAFADMARNYAGQDEAAADDDEQPAVTRPKPGAKKRKKKTAKKAPMTPADFARIFMVN